jgi:hypothetical protein
MNLRLFPLSMFVAASKVLQVAAALGLALCASMADAQNTSLLFPERVSKITVTPVTAEPGVAREIRISGNWPGCPPVGANLGAASPGTTTRVARMVLPATFAPCAAILAYSVTTTVVPSAIGIEKLLVLNVDGEYLGETLVDTRASSDNRSGFNITGMWYDPQSNGSGLTFVHSRVNDNAVFGTWYVYDSSGKPRWYTIQNAAWKSQGRVLEGVIYETLAPVRASCPAPLTACPAEVISLLLVLDVGRARVTLTGPDRALVEALARDGSVVFSSNVMRAEI